MTIKPSNGKEHGTCHGKRADSGLLRHLLRYLVSRAFRGISCSCICIHKYLSIYLFYYLSLYLSLCAHSGTPYNKDDNIWRSMMGPPVEDHYHINRYLYIYIFFFIRMCVKVSVAGMNRSERIRPTSY